MPTAYRVEEAKTGRSGCRNTECKKNKVQIGKGELRFGTLVEIQEHQSWHWKHWGCTTPLQLANWKDMCDGDMELVDGYDELTEENKAKVERCIEQGHVDDSDWKGDPDKNRPGQKGFHKTKKELLAEAKAAQESPPKGKKRDRSGKSGVDDGAEEAEQPPKKKKTTKSKQIQDEEESGDGEKPKPKKKVAKKVKVEPESDDEGIVKAKRSRSKKVKTEEFDVDLPAKETGTKVKSQKADVAQVSEKKGRAKKVKGEDVESKPTKKTAARAKNAQLDGTNEATAAKPAKHATKKKTNVEISTNQPDAKGKGRKKRS